MKKVCVLLLVAFMVVSCYSPLVVVTGETRTPTNPENIEFYSGENIPEHYEVIGEINVQSESTLGRKGAHKRNMKKLRTAAAELGANGIVIRNQDSHHDFWGDSFIDLNVLAIFVNEEE